MTPPLSAIICALVFVTSVTLRAQTYVKDDSASPAVNTYSHLVDYQVGRVVFNNGTGKASNPWTVDPVSLKTTKLTTTTGQVTAYDFCAQLFVIGTGDSTYSVTEGFGPINASQQIAIRKLISNTLTDFIAVKDVDYDAAAIIGSAIQLALWEVIEDNPSGVSFASLDEDSPIAGDLSIKGFDTDPPTYTGTTRAAVDLSETYLAELRSGNWEDLNNFEYQFADGGAEQDRLWVTVIPEPSIALLGLMSLGILLHRKRA